MFFSRRAGHKYIDRGYITTIDFNKDVLTLDDNWHTLDLSAIIPKNAILCVIYVEIRTVEGNIVFTIITNGPDDTVNVLPVRCKEGGNSDYVSGTIRPDSDGLIKYCGSIATYTRLNIVIKGWYV